MVTNQQFLHSIFGDDDVWCHVTDFIYDPGNIPKDRHQQAWSGDYFSRYKMSQNTNQYFTISCFYGDDQGKARRRKALYRHTPCIVLDDVKEKLSMVEVSKLPAPSWVLESSKGSEQWGYILDTPCTERSMVENLLDGLVANGLAPQGKDPGMKGVTRYVRLPEGINNKASRLDVLGNPWPCKIVLWEPDRKVTMRQLATPFDVDLYAVRRESRVDGAGAISDHPLINIPDVIKIKEVRSDGRFDIVCPWVSEHTDADDSGAAVFTNTDGSIGFKCHHGNCQEKTGRNLLQFIEGVSPGFGGSLKNWQVLREFANVETVSFMATQTNIVLVDQGIENINVAPTVPGVNAPVVDAQPPLAAPAPMAMQVVCDQVRQYMPGTPDQFAAAANALKHVDDLPKMDQKHWHKVVSDHMGWSKPELKDILKDLREGWYSSKAMEQTFYDDVVFVKELNQFYDRESRIFFTPDAFQNSFSDEDVEAKKTALQDGRVTKVDKLDYAPNSPPIFKEGKTTFGNLWTDANQPRGAAGDISRWRDHFDALGWADDRKHIEQWMAYTLRFPERKINHMILLGSGEGCGKDFLLYPLTMGMGDNGTVISGEELLEGFNDYLLSSKYLHINEIDLGDRQEATHIANKLKPIAAAPPMHLSVNQKGIKRIKVRNVINGSMTTNSQLPMRLNGPSRRFFALWSDLNPRDERGNMRQEWKDYWEDRWVWMRDQSGWQNVLHYLLNDVDLSDFNPGEAPPVTDFLREIQDSSKSPMELVIEDYINDEVGLFKSDLLTSKDISDMLKTDDMFPIISGSSGHGLKYITPTSVGRAVSTSSLITSVRGRNGNSAVRINILRNHVKYSALGGSELFAEYARQIAAVKGDPHLRSVK